MEAEGLANALNAIVLGPSVPNFDPIMNTAIDISGNERDELDERAYPLDERSLKAFLAGYHFDRRCERTTDEVIKYSNEVFEVYQQLFELRDTADVLKSTDKHQSSLVMRRIAELLADLNKVVARGRIPSHRNAEHCQLNLAITAALVKTGLEGPLNHEELRNLIIGASALHIEVQKVRYQNAEGVAESRKHYFAHVVPVQDNPQEIPESTDNPIGSSLQVIIDQFKRLRSHIKTNQKNEKSAYDIIYQRLNKAIDDLRTENGFAF